MTEGESMKYNTLLREQDFCLVEDEEETAQWIEKRVFCIPVLWRAAARPWLLRCPAAPAALSRPSAFAFIAREQLF